MSGYTPEQIGRIRRAVAEAREAMRRQDSFTPLSFAGAFIERDGIQIPGAMRGARTREEIAAELLAALREGKPTSEDPVVAREIQRARAEVHWAAAARSDKVVGFRLQLSPEARRRPECLALLNADRGLGPSVFRKGEVVVLPPGCEGAEFIPVREDDVEQ